MVLPHELFDLNAVFTAHGEACRILNVSAYAGNKIMQQLKYMPLQVAGRPHWYTQDVHAAKLYIDKHGVPAIKEIDAWAKRKQLESSFGLPGASHQEMPELYK